jgi:hypothetical protein
MSISLAVFGPSKEEIWRQFCSETGGRYIDGGFWKGGKAEAAHGQWTVTLDTYRVSTGKTTVTYTRMRAPYVNPDGFRFTVYRKDIFSGLGKLLGMQDVEVGYAEFDEAFIIKGNDERKLRNLFANQRIRELISVQPQIRFEVTHVGHSFWRGRDVPKDVDELSFHVRGLIKDVERLKLLYDLFSETLDELCRMGLVYEQDPGVKL